MFAIISLSRFVRATGKLHDKSLECIFHSPMAFFDTTPVGRIMNRFSSDIDVIDDRFPRTFRIMSVMSCVLLGTIIVIVVTTPISVVVIIPMIILYIVAIVSILFPFFVRVMVFNATFNNIFVISRQ